MAGFFAGVVRKKYTLLCVAPDGSQVEIAACYDAEAARVSKEATERILELMQDSFEEMQEGFHMKIIESMESADDVPLTGVEHR